MYSAPKVGEVAPNFTLRDQHGNAHTLSTLDKEKVALCFYPADDTPICTKQINLLNAELKKFEELGIKVFGISFDSMKSHKKFAEKHNLSLEHLAKGIYSVNIDRAGKVETKKIVIE